MYYTGHKDATLQEGISTAVMKVKMLKSTQFGSYSGKITWEHRFT